MVEIGMVTVALKRKQLQLPQFWMICNHPGQLSGPLNDEGELKLRKLLHSYPDVITDNIGYTTTIKHRINCKDDDTPIKQKTLYL